MSRYLGQHFLLNKKKIGEIIEALELKDGDVVIEIGPGKGALTIPLVEQCQKLSCEIIAIEKDKELAENLVRQLADKNIEIIEGDALKEIKNQSASWWAKINPSVGGQKSKIIENLKIVGNIPYYITGYLLRILGELENKPSLIVLTIQKEVAQRVCVKPRTRRRQGYGGQGMNPPHNFMWGMNLLAASVQFWAESKIIGYIPKKDFRPAPKVDSAIIKLKSFATPCGSGESRGEKSSGESRGEKSSGESSGESRGEISGESSSERYYKFIKILFKQPRKTILNNLKLMTNDQRLLKEKLNKIGIEPNARPQNLDIEQIIKLSQMF